MSSRSIQLVLLDIRLKDGNGIDFLTDLRRTKQTVDVILITAANEVNIVNDALHLGVIDYLIKPFTLERFEKSIQRYRTKHQALVTDQLDQSQLDTYFEPQTTIAPTVDLDKGLSKATLQTTPATIYRRTINDRNRSLACFCPEIFKFSRGSSFSERRYDLSQDRPTL